jgi:formate hydrogenlyase transcriptional activator
VYFDYVALILHDPETDKMDLHVIEILFETEPPSVSLPMDGTPSGLCFRTQQPLIIDVDTEKRFSDAVMAILRKYLIKSCCYLPLTTSLRRLGAITFGSREPDKFLEFEMPFLRRVANQVAVAVDTISRRHGDIKNRLQQNAIT